MPVDEKIYALALSYTQELGAVNCRKLIQHFGSAKTVWNLGKGEIHRIKGLRKKSLEDFANPKNLERAHSEIEQNEEENIQSIGFWETLYPERLVNCADAPIVLFVRGKTEFPEKCIAVVGTRKMTSYGRDFIHELIGGLKTYNLGIVSGLALGCDAAAHNASLENGLPTFGVLANHVSQIRPKTNAKIGTKILDQGGAILSEFSRFHHPEPINFIRRNRIVAGLCDLTIVIESDIKGGAMSTARFANMYNRDVMALPNGIHVPTSRGCNHLIATHQAFLLRNAEDLLYHLDLKPKKKSNPQRALFVELSPPEEQLYTLLKQHEKLHIDELAQSANLPTYRLLPILLELEMKQLIRPLPGKYFAMV